MRPFLLLPLLLGACANPCDGFLGEYTGSFEGDASGDLSVTVTEAATAGDVEAVFDLAGEALSGFGSDIVSCETGTLEIDLTDVDGLDVGTVTGSLGDGSGSGDWSGDGASGTWSY